MYAPLETSNTPEEHIIKTHRKNGQHHNKGEKHKMIGDHLFKSFSTTG